MFPRIRWVTMAALLVLLMPGAARAVTLDDIIALSKAGVSADVLVAVIDADRTIFSLNTEQIVLLRKAGVPNSVIIKMLGTAREFVDEVPPPLIVGTDRPSAPVEYSSSPTYVGPAFVPVVPYFVVPYPVFMTPVKPVVPAQPVTGSGRFINNGWVPGRGFGRFMNDGFVDPRPVAPK
jgi:hypothetical protein